MALQFVLVMRRAQAFQALVAHDAGRAVGRGERALPLGRIRSVVFDAPNERRACFDDLPIEFVIEIAPVDDVETSRPQHLPQLVRFRTRRGGDRSIQRGPAEDVKVQMKLDPSMLGILPQGPGHARKRAKDTAIYGGEMEQLLCAWPSDNGRSLTGQFVQDLVQCLGVKQPRGLAKRPQRRGPNAETALHRFERRSLLQAAQAGNRRTKEVEQEETDVLVVKQLAVACPIALGTDVPEPRQQGRQRIKVLQPLDIAGQQIASSWSGHDCLPAIPAVTGYA